MCSSDLLFSEDERGAHRHLHIERARPTIRPQTIMSRRRLVAEDIAGENASLDIAEDACAGNRNTIHRRMERLEIAHVRPTSRSSTHRRTRHSNTIAPRRRPQPSASSHLRERRPASAERIHLHGTNTPCPWTDLKRLADPRREHDLFGHCRHGGA